LFDNHIHGGLKEERVLWRGNVIDEMDKVNIKRRIVEIVYVMLSPETVIGDGFGLVMVDHFPLES
jgi:hypothetical protein